MIALPQSVAVDMVALAMPTESVVMILYSLRAIDRAGAWISAADCSRFLAWISEKSAKLRSMARLKQTDVCLKLLSAHSFLSRCPEGAAADPANTLFSLPPVRRRSVTACIRGRGQ
jgi:hypothetical protein